MTAGAPSRHRLGEGAAVTIGERTAGVTFGTALLGGCSGWLVGPVVMWLWVRCTPVPVASADSSPVVVLPI